MRHSFNIGEAEYDVALSRTARGYALHLNDGDTPCNLVLGATGDWVLHCGGVATPCLIATHGDDVFIHLNGETHHLRYAHPLARLAQLAEGSAEDNVRATMPGSVVSLAVAPGQAVAVGDMLLVMESMKMETTLVAPRDGVVEEILVGAGETFDKDALLITLQSQAEDA